MTSESIPVKPIYKSICYRDKFNKNASEKRGLLHPSRRDLAKAATIVRTVARVSGPSVSLAAHGQSIDGARDAAAAGGRPSCRRRSGQAARASEARDQQGP